MTTTDYKDMPNTLNKNSTLALGTNAIEQSLRNILSISRGTMPGYPEFGSGINKYLFEMINPLTAQLIKTEITYAIEKFEPRIQIVNINVSDDPDYNRIIIKIVYSVLSDSTNTEKEFIYTTKLLG